MKRSHIVLVPGFAGFDALGQLEYYAGVTPTFRGRKSGGGQAVLHYFDNFPTAGVSTRAQRLRRYLTKRIARGEFQPGDSVALVGHSTGGLDIHQLLWELCTSPQSTTAVDSSADVPTGELLELIHRVVFLSVPQLGTNIAHWVRENLLGRAVVVAQLRASVAASQVPFLRRVQDLISGSAAAVLDMDLLRAVNDAVHEAESPIGADATATAAAHEAAAQLELWLRHVAWDFSAIEDLCPRAENQVRAASPAQFTQGTRDDELRNWRRYEISTRSWATVSPCPFRFEHGKAASYWSLLNPCTWPDLTPAADHSKGIDVTYRYCYRACAGGPFRYPASEIPVPRTRNGVRRPIEVWDNDGIVNTASMLWPSGADTVLVECDHEDITGHFERVAADDADRTRKYRSYDLLGSGSGFDRRQFQEVWNDIFEFCTTEDAAVAATA